MVEAVELNLMTKLTAPIAFMELYKIFSAPIKNKSGIGRTISH
jgi:hypothetical protein